MKILLIDPPFKSFTGFANYYYPMGLAYLAACLRIAGHEVVVLDVDSINKNSDIDFSDEYRRLELYIKGLNDDSNAIWMDIEKITADFTPDIVGITAMTTKMGSVLKTAKIIKRQNPSLPVIAGGPHANLRTEQILKSKNIDIVVRGEGEDTIIELISIMGSTIRSVKNTKALKTVKGISYKSDSGVIHNPDREFIKDLNTLPFPARDSLMHPENYSSEDMGAIMASRGCPFDCSYCCHPWGKKVRHRSVENVTLEIKEVMSSCKTRQFEFKDDSFTVNKKWTIDFCERLIDEKMNINWGCTTRVDLLDDQIVGMMKKSGCNIIKIGIETGSQKVLKETNKGVSLYQIKNCADILNKHKMFWSGYFMVGLPLETKEDIMMTCDIIKELNPYYAGLGVYNPFPGTRLFDYGVETGLLNPEVELEHFFNTNPKDYYFKDPGVRVLKINKLEFDELLSTIMKIVHKHNVRFKNIVRRAWARRKLYYHDYGLLFGDFKKAARWIIKRTGKKL